MEQRGGDRANNNEEQSLSSAIISRRKLLEMSGAAAAVGLAGCSSGDDTESTSTPLQGKNRDTATLQNKDGNTKPATQVETWANSATEETYTDTKTDAETTTEPGTPENTETSTSTETSEPTTQTTTTPEEPRIVDSPYDNPFHYVPDPEFFLEDDIVTKEEDLIHLPIVLKIIRVSGKM